LYVVQLNYWLGEEQVWVEEQPQVLEALALAQKWDLMGDCFVVRLGKLESFSQKD
jgi:hypothetical protein